MSRMSVDGYIASGGCLDDLRGVEAEVNLEGWKGFVQDLYPAIKRVRIVEVRPYNANEYDVEFQIIDPLSTEVLGATTFCCPSAETANMFLEFPKKYKYRELP